MAYIFTQQGADQANPNWLDVGAASELSSTPVRRIEAEGVALALSYAGGTFAAIAAKHVMDVRPPL